MENFKTILVTGANGFIGKNLIKKLEGTANIISIDFINGKGIQDWTYSDIKDNLENLNNIDLIYHLGAFVRVQESLDEPKKYLDNNIQSTQAVLDLARSHRCKVVYAGSASKHGGTHLSPYASSKFLGEELCKLYRTVYKIPVEIARFYNVYGPGEHVRPQDASVFGIWRWNAKKGKQCSIVGDGEQTRDFVHVEDIVEGLIKIAESNETHEDAWELGSGESISVNELAFYFKTRYPDLVFYNVEDQLGNFRKSELVNNEANRRLGWNPKRKILDYISSL